MDCERLPFVPDTPNDDLVLLHQYRVSETYALHRHEFYEVFYVLRGQALHEMDGSSQVVSEGTLVFIRPDDAHCYKVLNCDDFEFVNVNIAGSLAAQAFRWLRIPQESFDRPKLPPSIRLLGAQHEEMQRKFLELSRMSPGPERRRSFCALIPEVLLLLFTRADMERTPVMPPWLTEVLQKLDDPACFTQGLPELLRMTPYTQEHLTRSFRRYVHTTPTAYINQKRLNYAAALRADRSLAPAAVAQRAGFHNLSHFYHLFRQQYGCTPLQYSARYRDEQSAQSRCLRPSAAARSALARSMARRAFRWRRAVRALRLGRAHAHLPLPGARRLRGPPGGGVCALGPALTPGALLHINRENASLFHSICKKYGCTPVAVRREFLLTRSAFCAWGARRARPPGDADRPVRAGRRAAAVCGPALPLAGGRARAEPMPRLCRAGRGRGRGRGGALRGGRGGSRRLPRLPPPGDRHAAAAGGGCAVLCGRRGPLLPLSAEEAQEGLAFARGLSLAQTGHEAVFAL